MAEVLSSFHAMKKLVIIGSMVSIIILIIALLLRHSQGPSYKLLAGTWVQQDSLGTLVLRPAGKYNWRMYSDPIQHDAIPDGAGQWLYDGTWDVKDGVLVLSISFANARNSANVEPVGTVDRFRVIKFDDYHLELEKEGVTTDFHRAASLRPWWKFW